METPLIAGLVWVLVVLAWAGITVLNILVGWKSCTVARGSRWRLLWVAGGLGLIQVMPMAVWGAFESADAATEHQPIVAYGGTIFATICAFPFLQPPVRLIGTSEKLPGIEGAPLLARIADLAGRMGVKVPYVWLWPSTNSSQQALAFAGTLQAPQLAVTDGILNRLSAPECDAILAHELAHVANGSLWALASVFPLGSATATLASGFFPPLFSTALGLTFCVGLRRIVSRPIEYDCDRRAATVCGFQQTTSALAKVHAILPIPDIGMVSLWTYATATHPPLALRLEALRKSAPADDRPEPHDTPQVIRRHRRAAQGALAIWLLMIGGSCVAAWHLPGREGLAIPLLILSAIPTILLISAQRRQMAISRRHLGKRVPWIRLALAAVATSVINLFPQFLGLISEDPLLERVPWLRAVPGLLLLGGLFFLIRYLFWLRKSQQLRQQVAVALQLHQFERALELGHANPKQAARDHFVRHNLALARAVCGDRELAIADLVELCQDKPHFPLPALFLAHLLIEAEQFSRALDVARTLQSELPGDFAPLVLEARALRGLGRRNEAETVLEQADSLEPRNALISAVRAALFADHGEYIRAEQEIDMALERAPGESYVLLVQAELAIKTQPLETARRTLEENSTRIRANRLAFLSQSLERLERKLHEREGAERDIVVSPESAPSLMAE